MLHLHTSQGDVFPLGRAKTSCVNFTLSHPIMAASDEVIFVSVDSLCVPNTRYAVDSSNNSVGAASDWGDTTLTLTPKNYTASTLVTEINSALSSINVTAAFDSATGKLTFSTSHGFDTTIKGTSSASRVLGLCRTDLVIPAGGSIEAPGVVDLLSRGFALTCEGLDVKSRDSSNSGSSSNILCVVHIDKPFGQTVLYTDANNDILQCNRRSIQNIELQLIDLETMQPVELNGAEWSVNLKFQIS